jgi:hypothetical protein
VIEIPRRSYSKGAKKALRSMKRQYGAKKGESVFYARANKYGKRGASRLRKINATYKKGARLKRRRRTR